MEEIIVYPKHIMSNVSPPYKHTIIEYKHPSTKPVPITFNSVGYLGCNILNHTTIPTITQILRFIELCDSLGSEVLFIVDEQDCMVAASVAVTLQEALHVKTRSNFFLTRPKDKQLINEYRKGIEQCLTNGSKSSLTM